MFYTQSNRLMKVTTPLGPNVLLATEFRGHEAISELFRFEVDLIASRFIPIPFENILGQPITVEIALPNGTERRFSGIVSRFSQGSRDDTFTHFKAEVVPKFWLLKKQAQSRIFQHKTIPEILETVLESLDVSFEFSVAYEPRDYCVQYRETDFAFASRLMEEEGISYCFQHSDEGHQMLVWDSSLQLPDVPGPSIVVFDDLDEGLRDDARVSNWQKSQEVSSTEFSLWDHCFELPDQNLEARQVIVETVEAGTVTHKLSSEDETREVYDFPGAFAQRFDGVESGGGDRAADLTKIFEDNKRTVKLRMEEEAAQSIQINGESNCVQLTPGHKFALIKHFNADGQYVLTGVEHVARLATEYRSGGGEDTPELEYENSFTCIPQTIPYRPRRLAPKPTVVGVQTATVVGPEGQEIFVDKYGRVKVQFHWDRQGQRNADSSCWIRVSQFWAGPRWGAFFWPRIGHEVVVSFAEGDPDQPVIVGNVYNAANMPPLPLPEHKEAGGIKSCTVGEESAEKFNSVIFHDHPGDEHVHIHSETHEAFTSEGSKYSRTPGPQIRVCGSLPFGLGSGGGGGDDGELGQSRLIAMAGPILHDGGSGGGGGMLEWPAAIGELGDIGWIKSCTKHLPGDAKYVFGSQTNATMLGDRNAHILVGADLRVVVDLEAMATDAIMDKLKAGFMASQIVSGLGGAGGSTAFICGPNSTLTYGGDQLSVARGDCYQVRSNDVDCPYTTAAKALAVAAALATMVADVVADIYLKQKKSLEGTDDEFWAALDNTVLSALPSRLLALLIGFETENAKVQAKALKAKEAAQFSEDALEATENRFTGGLETAESYSLAAERRVKAIIDEEAAHTAKILDGDFKINAEDISLVSTCEEEDSLFGGSDINIYAEGGGLTSNNGTVRVQATKEVSLACRGLPWGPRASFIKNGEEGKIKIGNNLPGSIEIKQGALAGPMAPGSPGITLSDTPPSIKLQVGLPGEGACLELTPEGLIAKFGLNTIALSVEGIVMESPKSIVLSSDESGVVLSPEAAGIGSGDSAAAFTPEGILCEGPDINFVAEGDYNIDSMDVNIDAAVVDMLAGIIFLA